MVEIISGVAWIREREEMSEGGAMKWYKETFDCDRYAHYLDCGGDFTGIYKCPKA